MSPEEYKAIREKLALTQGGLAARLVMMDIDGDRVTDGDEIIFAYGIPPVRVCAQVEAFEGELWALTPGHNPSRCRLSELRAHVELFYKA